MSIAPTEISETFDDERRNRLSALIERDRKVDQPPAVEIGWTHFWPEYRRPIGGRLPLNLFAINYQFQSNQRGGFDPWFEGLIRSGRPVAPISGFCRDVLVHAGVDPSLTFVVPMGYTDGLESASPGQLRAARSFKVLHTTNSADLARNGTDLALAAFEAAFSSTEDVTLVIRDYGLGSSYLKAQTDRLRARGYDVRYWPVFLSQSRLGTLTGAFDVALSPYRGEGFGIKLLDAMACGVPVIAPDFGGPRDFIDESVAYLVPFTLMPVSTGYDSEKLQLGNGPLWAECDHGALVSALHASTSERGLADRSAQARRRALGRFSWRAAAQTVLSLADAV